MSNLQNKSEIVKDAAELLHNKNYYPAVAHEAYYCCYPLLKHIWLYDMKRTQQESDTQCRLCHLGSHEFLIISELEIFIKIFSNVRVRYEYNESTLTHIIEIVPNEVYYFNHEYISWESKLFDKFINLYPTENICFISDDVLVGIKNEIYSKEGLDYTAFYKQQENIICDPNQLLFREKK